MYYYRKVYILISTIIYCKRETEHETNKGMIRNDNKFIK